MSSCSPSANKLLLRLEEERDWNKAYQDLLCLNDGEHKFVQLRLLAQDFVDAGPLLLILPLPLSYSLSL